MPVPVLGAAAGQGRPRLLEGEQLRLGHREGVAGLREAARLDSAHVPGWVGVGVGVRVRVGVGVGDVLVQRRGHWPLEPRELVREARHLLIVQPEQVVEDLDLVYMVYRVGAVEGLDLVYIVV